MNSVQLLERQLKVAIVEDDPIIRRNVLKYVSMDTEIAYAQAFTSVEALFRDYDFQKDTFDVLLLDIGLPGISGLEALPNIASQKPTLDIIMLTAFEDESTIVKALCTGAVAYVSKKAGLSEITQAIRVVQQGGSYMSPMIAREILHYMVRGGEMKKQPILTNRQTIILEKLVEGKSYGKIADELELSIETVRTHIKRMYKVLHVSNKVEAVAKYLKGEI